MAIDRYIGMSYCPGLKPTIDSAVTDYPHMLSR
jgi:hypothetical protein